MYEGRAVGVAVGVVGTGYSHAQLACVVVGRSSHLPLVVALWGVNDTLVPLPPGSFVYQLV